MNYKKLIAASTAAFGLIANAGLPVFATTIEIVGNGSGSNNYATVTQTTTTSVTQNNVANVSNVVNSNASTGGNDASFNTGGQVAVATGNATTNVQVSNDLNTNVASVDCCDQSDTLVKIDENGAYSTNNVKLGLGNTTVVGQNNVANVVNDVDADATTGKNDANLNTGGDVTLLTGNAKTTVGVSTKANVNVAEVGGGVPSAGPSAAFIITGNGAYSDNFITAVLGNATVVEQANVANVVNEVDANAKTGKNDEEFNTGGDVLMHTGDATAVVGIDNEVNFNAASLDCGCDFNVTAKIAGNGASPDYGYGWGEWPWFNYGDNVITLDLTAAQVLGQGNVANLVNDATDVDASTGWNDNSLNTGSANGDPILVTGNASTSTMIQNSGNVNTDGGLLPIVWPNFSNMQMTFDMSIFWALFGFNA